MSTALSDNDKETIKASLLQARDLVLHADDWVGSPNLIPVTDGLCRALDPFCAPVYDKPAIALQFGALHERIGAAFVEKSTFPPEASHFYFDRAAVYFEKAAAMVANPSNRFAPARAKLGLSQLYDAGLIGTPRLPDKRKAFAYMLAAANDGLAEAQMFAAFAFFEGNGTAPSIAQAVFWMHAAYEGRAQLDPQTQNTVIKGKERLETLFLRTCPADNPRERQQALQDARFGSFHLVTSTPQ